MLVMSFFFRFCFWLFATDLASRNQTPLRRTQTHSLETRGRRRSARWRERDGRDADLRSYGLSRPEGGAAEPPAPVTNSLARERRRVGADAATVQVGETNETRQG